MSQAAPQQTRHILAADIGGTNSRFGHFILSPAGELELRVEVRLPTNAFPSFPDLLAGLESTEFGLPPARADAAVFAVPGAPVGDRIAFANIAWSLDLAVLHALFPVGRSACINDFTAQALGCRMLAHTADAVLPGHMDPAKVQAVIGAGTGLGHAALLPGPDGGCEVLPSEAGQAAASFTGPDENAFAAYLCRVTGENYVRRDSVLSGSGLAHLHHFLTGHALHPSEVGRLLTPQSETTALFARFYGRAARDYALTVLAAGGVFISGGVAAKNPLLVRHPEFSRAFHDSPTYAGLLTSIPVRLLRDERTGLFGAARFATTLLGQTS